MKPSVTNAILSLLAVASLLSAAPLPPSVYSEIAAGIPDGVLDLTTDPGPGSYDMTDGQALAFPKFSDATVLAKDVIIKPYGINFYQPVYVKPNTRLTGQTFDKRLLASGPINVGTTQLECHYTTGLPVAKLNPNQRLQTMPFTLVNPVGVSMCYWYWAPAPWDNPGHPTVSDVLIKGTTESSELYVRGNSGYVELMIQGCGVSGGPYPPNAYLFATAAPVETGEWNFVAVYFNQAANQLGVSVNGAAFTTLTTTGTWTASPTETKINVGGRNCRMSNVWLWKGRVLTLAEFQAIYNGGIGKRYTDLTAGQKTSLTHAWEMDEGTGTTRMDSHGSNNLIESVNGPIAQHLEGWTGTVDHPLTHIIHVGDRVMVQCGVQIADAQEPKYGVFRGIAAISGNTITFDEPFQIACENFGDSATMLAQGADPQKVGYWGGSGETPPYLHPYSEGTNSYGFAQRGWGTSHDLTLFADGHTNVGLTIKDLTIDWSNSVHKRNGTTCIFVDTCENVRFENLTVNKQRGYNVLLFNRCKNSGVDGLHLLGDSTGAIFADGTDYVSSICPVWGGEGVYYRNLDIRGNGSLLCNAESGTIDAVIENVRLTGGSLLPVHSQFGVHFGSYGTQYRSGTTQRGITFKNCYFDTLTDPAKRINYYTSSTAGFDIDGMTYASGEFSDSTEFRRQKGYIRVGKRIFGPRTELNYNFPITYDGTGFKTYVVPVGFYAAWPVLTLDTRANLAVVSPSNAANLLTYVPTGNVLNFGVPAIGGMQVWDRAGHGPSVQQVLDSHYILFAPTGSLTETRNYNFTATYFPECTDTVAPTIPIVANTRGALRASNGKGIALRATP